MRYNHPVTCAKLVKEKMFRQNQPGAVLTNHSQEQSLSFSTDFINLLSQSEVVLHSNASKYKKKNLENKTNHTLNPLLYRYQF